ncbi:MAG: redoxin domain-containing protein [Bacteroidales bacterium]|nr:redoxin domain-containing protein [Bacteroidales bacterium]
MFLKKILLYIISFVLCLGVFAQTTTIKFSIPDYSNSEILFCSQFGDNAKIIDTIYTNTDGEAVYQSKNLTPGVYRLFFNDDKEFDLIVNETEISVSLISAMPVESMQVVKSAENKMFYQFINKNKSFDKQIDVLLGFMAKYPKGNLYTEVEKEYANVIEARKNFVEQLISKKPNSLAARIIKYSQNPIFPLDVVKAGTEMQYLKANYFNIYPCDDEDLIYTPVYSSIIIDYLKLYSVPNNYEASVNGFYSAATKLMDQTAGNEKINSHFLKILINGFESLQLFDLADKLVANYGKQCLSADNMAIRYKNVTELKLGTKAPVLFIQNKKSEPEAYEFTRKTLVVFWATWCDHCRQIVPNLNYIVESGKIKNTDIVLISLDSDRNDLKRFIKEANISIPISCDYLSWEGVNAKNYAIYATPYYYIIDETGKIIAKPNDYRELMELIN